jgi:hypothetical protein
VVLRAAEARFQSDYRLGEVRDALSRIASGLVDVVGVVAGGGGIAVDVTDFRARK